MITTRTSWTVSHALLDEHKTIFHNSFSRLVVDTWEHKLCTRETNSSSLEWEGGKSIQKLFFIINSLSPQLDEYPLRTFGSHTHMSILGLIQSECFSALRDTHSTRAEREKCVHAREMDAGEAKSQPSDNSSLPAHDPNCGIVIDFSYPSFFSVL